ncbi:beta strand repeat-containing protein [Treponema sp.]|uniref:beta strand repeat-containing protein n=1 Tax=Treponema sp. TaxID=166 RepID=UPI00388D7F10
MIKKVLQKKLISLAKVFALGLATVFLTTCGEDAGLGSSVDTEAPSATISYPPDGSVIRDWFYIAGTCNDDKQVSKVTVAFTNTSTNSQYGPYTADVSDGTSWIYKANEADSEGNYILPDGSYSAKVYVYDNAGRSTGPYSLALEIDNTAPVFIVSAPNSLTSNYAYGTTLRVQGTVCESHSVSQMTLEVYDGENLNGTYKIDEGIDVSDGCAIDFARFTVNGTDTLYSNYTNIYGTVTLNDTQTAAAATNETKSFKTSITLADTAYLWQDAGKTTASEETGNTTSTAYLYDDVYNVLMGSGTTSLGLTPSRVIGNMNGKYTDRYAILDTTAQSLGFANPYTDDTNLSVKEFLDLCGKDTLSNHLAFSLNPAARPTYTFLSVNALTSGTGASSTKPVYNDFVTSKASTSSELSATITAFDSNTLVAPKDFTMWMYKVDEDNDYKEGLESIVSKLESSVYGASAAAPSGWTQIGSDSSENSVTSFSLTSNALGSTVKSGSCYIVAVTGNDVAGSNIYHNNVYAFIGTTSGTPPSITIETPEKSQFFKTSADTNLKIKGSVTSENELVSLKATITVLDEDNDETVTDGTTNELTYEKTINGGTSDTFDFKLSDCNGWSSKFAATANSERTYKYSLTVDVTDEGGNTGSISRDFYVDTVSPSVEITSVLPGVEGSDFDGDSSSVNTYVNGTIIVKAGIDDTHLASVYYRILVNGTSAKIYKKGTSDELETDSDGWYTPGKGTSQKIYVDTTKYEDGKSFKVEVKAVDSAGNETIYTTDDYCKSQYFSDDTTNTIYTYTIKQETDAPIITVTNADSTVSTESAVTDENLFDLTTKKALTATIKDDDSISSLVLNIDGEDKLTETITGTKTSYPLNYDLSLLNEGVYPVYIIAQDSTYTETTDSSIQALRKTTSDTFYISIDESVPVLTETSIGTSTQYKNDSFILSGTASDTNGFYGESSNTAVGAVTISYTGTLADSNSTAVSGEFSAVNLTSITTSNGTKTGSWSKEIICGTGTDELKDGSYTFVITVKDAANRETGLTRTVVIDTTEPVISTPAVVTASTTDSAGNIWYKSSELKISGTSSDTYGTGIKQVYYQTSSDGSNWSNSNDFAGTETWSGNVSNLVSATTTIKITAVDNAGNTNTVSCGPYYIDAKEPELTDNSVKAGTSSSDAETTSSYLANGKSDIYVSFEVTDEDGGSGISRIYVLPYEKITDSTATDSNKADYSNGTASFTIAKEKVTQSGAVYARIYDYAGNYTDVNLFTVTVDTTAPTITLNTPTDALKSTDAVDINKTINLSGNAEDGNTLPSDTITALQYSKDQSAWTDAAVSISGNYSFNMTGLDTTALTDETTYYLRAVGTDAAGNTGYSNIVTVFVNQKSDRPILNFTTLTTNANDEYILKLNDAGTVDVTVSDDDSTSSAVVKSVSIQELDASGNAVGSVITPAISASGDFTFASSSTDDGAKYFKFTVVDNEDTEFTSASSTSDYTTIPVLSVKTVAISDSAVASSSFTYKSDNESPVVDNITAVTYKSSGDESVTSEGISAAFVTGGTERENIALTIHASDANGVAGMLVTIAKTDGTTLKYKTTSETTIAGKTIADGYTSAGTFTATSTTGDSTWVLPSLSVAGLDSGSVKITVIPYDNSGLTGNGTFTFTVDNDGPAVNITSPKSYAADSSTQNNGSVTLTGTTTDSNDVTSVSWFIPTLTQQTGWPSLNKESLEWNDESDTVNFTFTGNTLLDNYANSTYTETSGTYSDPSSTYYVIPVYFRAVDEFGNIAYSTDYKILYNPDVDKITTTITNPSNEDALGGTVRMIGSTSISSYASVSLNSVYIQLGSSASFSDTDKTKAGTGTGNYGYTVVSAYDVINEIAGTSYTSSTMTDAIAKRYGFTGKTSLDSWWGIKTTTNAWKLNLNENKELDPTGDGVNTVYLRASAVNSNGKFGDWTDSIYVTINNKAPALTEQLYQFKTSPTASNLSTITASSNVTGEKSYSSDMYVKGQWYLEVTAAEAEGASGSYVKVESVTKDNANLTKGTDYFTTATSGDDTSVKIYIPVDKDSADTVVYKVTAMSKDGLFSSAKTYSINVDNTAPTIKPLYSDKDRTNEISMTKVENSNYKYSVYSTAIDEGSKPDFMAVYFMRDGQLELPLPTINSYTANDSSKVEAGTAYTATTGTSGTLKQITSTEAGEVLYGVSGTVSCAASGENTVITSSSLITTANSFIRRGSLVKLSGSYYAITEVNTTEHTATVNATFATLPTSAFFAAAIAVDSDREGGTTSSGVTTITNDDGDGFAETFDLSGTTLSWALDFFSDELDDGQIDIVVVAADKAGNYSTETTTVMLTNHKPRVSKVFLATDLNGDGKYTDNELGGQAITSSEGGTLSQKYYSALSGSVINSSGELEGSAQEISTLSYKSTEKDSDGNYYGVGFTMRNKLGVALEFVGGKEGNGDLKYQLAVASSTDGILTEPTAGTKGSVTARTSSLYDTTSDTTTTASIVSSSLKGFEIATGDISGHTEWVEATESTHKLSNIGITIWDSTNGTTAGTGDSVDAEGNTVFGSQYTVINVPLYIDLTDDKFPVPSIQDPAAVENAGHVELSSTLPSVFTDGNATKYLDRDTKISGEVTFTGTVTDEKRVSEIYLTTSKNFDSTAVSTKKVAAYSTTTGGFTITQPATGLTFAITGNEFSTTDGHTVTWSLTVDSSYVAGIAATDVVFTVAANDGTNTNGAATTVPYATYQVDVVPYITGITRTDTTKSRYKSTSGTNITNRSTYGSYPVAIGDQLTVTGYNFPLSTDTTNYVSVGGTTLTATEASTDSDKLLGTKNALVLSNNKTMTFYVPSNSGELTVTVNGILSLNHKNDNSQTDNHETSGSYTYYDNRYLDVYDVGHSFVSTDSLSHMPTMAADASGNLFSTWSLKGSASIQLEKGLTVASKSIFLNYDQPQDPSFIAIDKKATSETGTAANYYGYQGANSVAVMLFPAHVGNAGRINSTGYAAYNNCGGAFGIALSNEAAMESSTDTTASILYNRYYLADKKYTSGYQLSSYAMTREVEHFDVPRSARFGNNMHFAYYDIKNQALRYTYQPVENISALPTANANQFDITGWVLIDGTSDGLDRVHSRGTYDYANNDEKVGYSITYNEKPGNTAAYLGTNSARLSTTDFPNTDKIKSGSTVTFAIMYTNTQGLYVTELHTATCTWYTSGYYLTWTDSKFDNSKVSTSATNAGPHVAMYFGEANVVSTGSTQSSMAGSAISMDVTSTGCPVIAYYDSANECVRIAYANSDSPSLASAWRRQDVAAGGSDVAMKIDSNDVLHIVYVDDEGNLKYIKSTAGVKTPGVTADAYSFETDETIDTTGTYPTLSLIGTDNTPCVSYLNKAKTYNGIKYAVKRIVDSTESSAVWDTEIIPAVVEDSTNHYAVGGNLTYVEGNYQGKWSSSVSEDGVTVSDCDAAIGFQTDRMDVVFLKSEK